MYCTINKSTRVTSTTNTLIDHFWTNDYLNSSLNGIIYNDTSDHFPIFSSFKFSSLLNDDNNETSKNITYRDFKDNNILRFKNELVDVDWDLVFVNDVNVA